MAVKLFVDDERPCPEGWLCARTYAEARRVLQTEPVTHVSLDHDLGEELTGYDVASWIEENAPHITIACHSANPVGRARIMQVAEAIARRYRVGFPEP